MDRQHLRHGKALCGKVFARFVETFNWLVDFASNIKGDDDVSHGAGHIRVDMSDPSHPIVRCKGCASGGGGSAAETSGSPFAFTSSNGVNYVVNNVFYWDGEQKTIANYAVPNGSAAVYLVATQQAPSGGEQQWSFQLSNAVGQAPQNGRVMNFKLYDISSGEVTCDYRTTFLELGSPHKVCKMTVERYDSGTHPSVEIDASSSSTAGLVARSGTQGYAATVAASSSQSYLSLTSPAGNVILNTDHLTQGSVRFHKLTVNHADGTSDEYDVLSDSDITVEEASGTHLTDVTLSLDESNLNLTKTFSDGSTTSSTLALETQTVVTSSAYANNQFTNQTATLTVLKSQSGSQDPVFTAVAHSENS